MDWDSWPFLGVHRAPKDSISKSPSSEPSSSVFLCGFWPSTNSFLPHCANWAPSPPLVVCWWSLDGRWLGYINWGANTNANPNRNNSTVSRIEGFTFEKARGGQWPPPFYINLPRSILGTISLTSSLAVECNPMEARCLAPYQEPHSSNPLQSP